MPKTRILLAGLFGGLIMFIWASIAHMALPLGRVGISQINSNESTVLDALHTSLGDNPGFYLFPSMGDLSDQSAAMKTYDAKLVTNPSGILIYHPPGAKSLTPGQLITEFLVEMLEAFLAVWLLSKTAITSFPARVAFVTIAGILAALSTNVSYWNWYGFPISYTITYMATQIIGFALVGLTAAFVLGRR